METTLFIHDLLGCQSIFFVFLFFFELRYEPVMMIELNSIHIICNMKYSSAHMGY